MSHGVTLNQKNVSQIRMFKLPNIVPNLDDTIEVLVDYLEYQCIRNREICILAEVKKLLLPNDEILIDGIEDETDQALTKFEDIVKEINQRMENSNQKYPFNLDNEGYKLYSKKSDFCYWVYVYLLLSTRLNMQKDKKHNQIDGTKILEFLSAEIAKSYFGERSQSFVFGTGQSGSFQLKVNELCQKIGEGGRFRSRNKMPVSQQDDKLDVVVWIDFKDKNWSKLIGFGQCKTGTSFDDRETIELQPASFCSKWLSDAPIVEPIKMFFCSQKYPIQEYSKAQNAGLIFDRIRIMDYLPEKVDSNLEKEIRSWCEGVIEFLIKQNAA